MRDSETLKVDLVRDRAPQLHPKVVKDGVRMDSIEEIFANKICAFVGRSEIRDVIDLMLLERRGLRVEQHMGLARRKDGGATPATVAWLLGSLAVPAVLPTGIDRAELMAFVAFVASLEERMLAAAVPSAP